LLVDWSRLVHTEKQKVILEKVHVFWYPVRFLRHLVWGVIWGQGNSFSMLGTRFGFLWCWFPRMHHTEGCVTINPVSAGVFFRALARQAKNEECSLSLYALCPLMDVHFISVRPCAGRAPAVPQQLRVKLNKQKVINRWLWCWFLNPSSVFPDNRFMENKQMRHMALFCSELWNQMYEFSDIKMSLRFVKGAICNIDS